MTAPTITFGHGLLTDCNEAAASWGEGYYYASTLTAPTITSLYDDILDLTGTGTAANQQANFIRLFICESLTHTKYMVRWKTSDAAAGLGARVKLRFGAGEYQTIVGSATPEFSTVWHVSTGTVTAPVATTAISAVILEAVSDSNCGAGHHVYYDFILLHKGTFPFPSVSGKIHFESDNIYADLPIPSRIGNQTQYMGMNSPDIMLDGKIDVNTAYCSDRQYTTKTLCEAAGKTWFTWGTPYGEYLMLLMQQASADPFQWFTSDMVNCKVTPRRLILDQDGTALRTWQFYLKQYSRSGGQLSTWNDLQFWGV